MRRIIPYFVGFVVGLAVGIAFGQSPASELRAALADAKSLPEEVRATTRYISDYNRESAETPVAITFAINSVSRSRVLYRPEPVTRTLYRIDLARISTTKTLPEVIAAWEKLAPLDSYWHIRTSVIDPNTAKVVETTTDGGWTGLADAAELRGLTSSTCAVLRADFAVSRMLATLDGGLYYEFAGVPTTEKAFFESLGLDSSKVNELAANTAANLIRSNVTHKPRRVLVWPTPLGTMYQTKDVDSESPEKDPIRNPVDYLTQRFAFDASEFVFARPNGFLGYALYDSAGRVQRSVPDGIAHDSHGIDGRVQPALSCVRCHSQAGNQGFQPLRDDQSRLLTGEAAVLRSYSAEAAQRVAELYDPDRLGKALSRDREDYCAAVERATGVDCDSATAAVVQTIEEYTDQQVTTEKAAREVGLSPDQFVLATGGTNDPIILSLRAGVPVNRRAWESSFAEAAVLSGKQ